jgi:hypothetical protein
MAYISKRLTVLSAEIKEETTFGTENAPAAAADAFYLQPDSVEQAELVAEEFEFDGNIGVNAVGFGPNQQVAPSGVSGKVTLPTYFRGPGAAYSVSVFAKNRFHLGMKIAGYVPTLDATAAAEKYTYVQAGPEVTPVSATGYFWAKQLLGESKLERVKLLAMLASLKVDAPNARPPKFMFDAVGIYGGRADATFTAPTLAATPLPPLGTNMTFGYGAFVAGEVYSWSFDGARDLASARVPLTGSGANKGNVAGGYNPTVTIVLEQTKFSDWDPFAVRDAAGTAALALVNGSVQYNRIKLNGPQAQLIEVKEQNRGRIPLWALKFLLPPSTPAANDSHNWVTD